MGLVQMAPLLVALTQSPEPPPLNDLPLDSVAATLARLVRGTGIAVLANGDLSRDGVVRIVEAAVGGGTAWRSR